MKKILLIIIIASINLFSQTSTFEKRFVDNDGDPLLGATIDLVPQEGTYPADTLRLTEHVTRKGWYYRGAVEIGEYKIFINGVLYVQNIFHGENILTYLARATIIPETYGVLGDGTVNDSALTTAMWEAAKGKKILFTDSNYIFNHIIDIDYEGEDIELEFQNGAKITSTVTSEVQKYFAFWVGRSVGRPDTGDVYSTGSSTFRIVDTLVTECILGERITGTDVIASTGTLTRVSSSIGNATYSYTTLISQNGRYYLPIGALTFRNAGKVTIEGGIFRFSKDTIYYRNTGPYLDGILFKDCDRVEFRHNDVSNAAQYGVRFFNINNGIDVANNIVDSCYLAGMGFTACNGGMVYGNNCSYTGLHAPVNGYGITFTHQFGTWENNENIIARKNVCNWNQRKGIDIHGGVNLTIDDNTVYGFGDKGIAGHNSGDFEFGHNNFVKNLYITNNIIEQDTAWFRDLTFATPSIPSYNVPYLIGISVGSYYYNKPSGGPDDAGQVKVTGNRFKNFLAYQPGTADTLRTHFLIRCFAGLASNVIITDNIADSGVVEHGIFVGQGIDVTYDDQIKYLDISRNELNAITAIGHETTDTITGRIIVVTAGETVQLNGNKLNDCNATAGHGISVISVSPGVITNVKADENYIDGGSIGIGTGIYIRSGTFQSNNNVFAGNIQTGRCRTFFPSINGSSVGNSYLFDDGYSYPFNGDDIVSTRLPDYSSINSGFAEFSFQKDTTSAVDTLKTMVVDAGDSYPFSINGSAYFHIKLTVSSKADTQQAVYTYFVHVINDTTGQGTSLSYIDSVVFTADTVDTLLIAGTAKPPQIAFQNVSLSGPATGRLKRIDFYLLEPYTTYDAEIRFGGYRLQPYYRIHD